MEGLSQAISAGVPLTLDGKEYFVPPITFAEIAQIEAYMVSKMPTIIEHAEAVSKLDPSIQEKMFREIVQQHNRVKRVSQLDFLEFVTGNIDGICLMLYMCFNRKNPDVFTKDEFYAKIFEMANDAARAEDFARFSLAHRQASGFVGEAKNPTNLAAEKRKLAAARKKQAKRAKPTKKAK